jgi:hypothetical protein
VSDDAAEYQPWFVAQSITFHRYPIFDVCGFIGTTSQEFDTPATTAV